MRRPKRPCAVPMCPNLTTEKYCEEHAYKAKQEEAERQRFYDTRVRDKRIVEFYHTREWLAIRQQVLARDYYLCQHCLKEKRITPADMVHHIVPVKVDWTKRLDLSNLISLCNTCHAKIEHNRITGSGKCNR